jgi:proteasome assembly chaperone (PAC2) family protein
MARYRSNKGDFVFNNAVRKSGIDWGRDEGAGSIVGKSGLVVSTPFIDAVLPVRPP